MGRHELWPISPKYVARRHLRGRGIVFVASLIQHIMEAVAAIDSWARAGLTLQVYNSGAVRPISRQLAGAFKPTPPEASAAEPDCRRRCKGEAHPTRSRPRNLVRSWPPTVLIQPRASSIRLRMRWLTP